jgi:pimeloyl-ACP methyl ester carboxylesterase
MVMGKQTTLEQSAGHSLHVDQEGDGPDVVLIHGAMATGHDWLTSPVHAALTPSCRVTVIDRPGHGLSRRPRLGGTPREQADQIAEGLAQLGIRRAVFGGHSYGGLVAIAMAERHPELVAQMVLVAPLVFPEPRLLEHSALAPRAMPIFGPLLARFAEFTQLDRPMVDLLHQVMFSPHPVPVAWKESYPYDLILSAEAMVAEGEDAAAILPGSPTGLIDMRRIQVPAEVLTGTSDRVVEDERQAKLLARQLPNGSVRELEGAGHMLHHSHADHVLAALRAAIAAAKASPAEA